MTDFRKILRFAFVGRVFKGIAKAILVALGTVLNNTLNGLEVVFGKWHYNLTITPQVCFLEKMLNDEYDQVQRRIYIEEMGSTQGYFFFRDTDPTYLKFHFDKAFFIKDTRYGVATGFTVVLPTDIQASDRMRALIDRYKLISINYTIVNR
nr:MAG TPA: hypothetical protein [Caudoviricetes sp.]